MQCKLQSHIIIKVLINDSASDFLNNHSQYDCSLSAICNICVCVCVCVFVWLPEISLGCFCKAVVDPHRCSHINSPLRGG